MTVCVCEKDRERVCLCEAECAHVDVVERVDAARPVALMQRFLRQKTDALTAFVSHHDSGFFSLYRLLCSPKYIKTSVCTVWLNCCSSSSSSSLAPQSDDPGVCWMSGDVALFAGVVVSSSAVSVSAVCPRSLLSQVPRFESCFGPSRLPQEAGIKVS